MWKRKRSLPVYVNSDFSKNASLLDLLFKKNSRFGGSYYTSNISALRDNSGLFVNINWNFVAENVDFCFFSSYWFISEFTQTTYKWRHGLAHKLCPHMLMSFTIVLKVEKTHKVIGHFQLENADFHTYKQYIWEDDLLQTKELCF